MSSPHLDILLDKITAISKRIRALAKSAGSPDADRWLTDSAATDADCYLSGLIGEADDLIAAVAEVRRELKTIHPD